MVEYKDENLVTINNFEDVSISMEAFDKMIENSKMFYSYSSKEDELNPTLNMLTVKHKVLGVVAGLSYSDTIVGTTTGEEVKLKVSLIDENVVFNSSTDEYDTTLETTEKTYILSKAEGTKPEVTVKMSNVYTIGTGTSLHQVMYLVGGKTSAFDSMPSTYSELFIVVCK